MSESNTQIVLNLYQAFARGDLASVMGTLDTNIVWNEAENFPYADRNPYIGVNAVIEGVFMRIGGDWEGFSVSAKEILDAGDKVVGLGYYTGTFKRTRRSVRAQFAHIFTVRAGKITTFQQYTDTAQFARATALD